MRAAMPFKWGVLLAVLTVAACTSNPSAPLPEPQVDLDRYMGDWYVLASIPTPLETNAYDAIERYRLADDGTVETTFTYSNGSHDGEQREYTATGFVTEDPSNAVWEMQFLWPFRYALSGRTKSAGPFEIAAVLGKAESLNRINAYL